MMSKIQLSGWVSLIGAFFFASPCLSAAKEIALANDKTTTIIGRLLLQGDDSNSMLSSYDSNYIIHTYTNHINKDSINAYYWSNDALKDETKFQMSLGFPLYRGIWGENSLIGASYTQRSWWQSSNASQSSPFRETNYEPQLFAGFLTDYRVSNFRIKEIEFGLNHQSNGRAAKTSRSWNRVYFRTTAATGNVSIGLKVWHRFSERHHSNDDNPMIIQYLGHYQLALAYTADKAIFSAKGHCNLKSGFGNAELGASYQLTGHMRLYAQLFTGYGESMIDYNYKQTRFGLGVMLNDIF